jgi:hypothetical protein
LEINGHGAWKKDPWFFCKQVVMETIRILMDTYEDMEASRGHGDFDGNMKKKYYFYLKNSKRVEK